MMPPEKMAELGEAMASALDHAAREMTADEWAATLVGADREKLAIAIAAAEARGRRQGRRDLEGAVTHFELSYRYARNASRAGADAADLLTSAETFAKIAYADWRKVTQ